MYPTGEHVKSAGLRFVPLKFRFFGGWNRVAFPGPDIFVVLGTDEFFISGPGPSVMRDSRPRGIERSGIIDGKVNLQGLAAVDDVIPFDHVNRIGVGCAVMINRGK